MTAVDLAAMGAEPAWALLSLSMPRSDERWLADFADGLYALAERHGVALVGGDTVAGPLVVTVDQVRQQIAVIEEAHRQNPHIWGKLARKRK